MCLQILRQCGESIDQEATLQARNRKSGMKSLLEMLFHWRFAPESYVFKKRKKKKKMEICSSLDIELQEIGINRDNIHISCLLNKTDLFTSILQIW